MSTPVATRGSPWARALVVLGMVEAMLTFGACERDAHLVDEPDGGLVHVQPDLDAGAIPALDTGLGTDAYAACADRSTGDCLGNGDFPCGFDGLVFETAEACQVKTGCQTIGWLEVRLGDDGCVIEIGMDHPNDAMVACLLDEFGAVRCPCPVSSYTYYFGSTTTGLCPDGG
jgi:hypothetical protein